MAPESKFGFDVADREDVDATILLLKGPIDAFDTFSANGLKAVLTRWTNGGMDSKRRHLIIDFDQVTYCGSSGWGILFQQSSLLRKQGRGMVLCAVNSRVGQSLRLLGNNANLIQVAEHQAAAVETLSMFEMVQPTDEE